MTTTSDIYLEKKKIKEKRITFVRPLNDEIKLNFKIKKRKHIYVYYYYCYYYWSFYRKSLESYRHYYLSFCVKQ